MTEVSKSQLIMDQLDREKIDLLMNKTNNTSGIFEEIVDDIVNRHCSILNRIMADLGEAINDPKYPISDDELESACLKLPNALYFVGEAVEAVGIKADIAKAEKVTKFNEAFGKAIGTIPDKKTNAEGVSQYEQLVEDIFSRSVKKIRQKVEAGYEMLTSIKKVMTRRQQAFDLTNVDSARLTMAPRNINRGVYDE